MWSLRGHPITVVQCVVEEYTDSDFDVAALPMTSNLGCLAPQNKLEIEQVSVGH